jgi:Icc-related predicted phosphoesterase
VAGNHDFANPVPILNSWSILTADLLLHGAIGVKCLGVRFYGFGAVPFIDGEWAGETDEEGISRVLRSYLGKLERGERDMSDAIFVSHAPMHGVLDTVDGDHAGSRALRDFFETGLLHRPPLLLHGHIHEGAGFQGWPFEDDGRGQMFVSNACGERVHVIDFDEEKGEVRSWRRG